MPNFTAFVTAPTLNLRPAPSTSKPPLAKLTRGTQVTILETLKTWYQVESPEGIGFVHGDFLSVVDPSPCHGFLHERDDLKAMPLAPPPEGRLHAPADAAFSEKALARTWNRQGGMLDALSTALETEPAASVAVLFTESNGNGFTGGRMTIRFENHVFWRRWGKQNQEIFQKHFRFDARKAWLKQEFRADPNGLWAKFHGKQDREWQVLDFARRLDEDAALRSISMGGPQIMGFNHAAIGYDTPRQMFDNFQADERFHVFALFDFMKGAGCSSPMLEALRTKRFEDFAARYNGPGQAADYGHRIEQHHKAFLAMRG